MREGAGADSAANDQVVLVALQLFAGLGYDGVSPQMIADAAGVDVRVIAQRGGKSALYRTIIEDFHRAQDAMLDRVEAEHPPDEADRAQKIVDLLTDFYLDHPCQMAIWQHRGLDDAADLTEIGAYRDRVFARISRVIGPQLTDHPHFPLWVNQSSWSLRGFLFGGFTTEDGRILKPDSLEGRTRFRQQMRQLRTLLFDSAPPPDEQ